MDRKKLLHIAYNRDSSLHPISKNFDYMASLRLFTTWAMKQDLGQAGDMTTLSILENDAERIAHIIAKEDGIIAGIEEAVWFYSQYGINIRPIANDGKKIKNGDIIIELSGKETDLLRTERTGLNLLQRMSGIATLANRFVKRASPMIVAGTRKTHWGLLDNKAVAVGGGATHRLGLWESILIKENHLEALSEEGDFDPVDEAVRRAWKNKDRSVFIEIEVKDTNQAIKAGEVFKELNKEMDYPCIIMLDNFSPIDAKKTISSLKEKNLHDYVLIEASGGINIKNIAYYKDAGVDVASVGFLTHSPKSLDMSQLIIRD